MSGYEFLPSSTSVRMPPLVLSARVKPVTDSEQMPGLLAVPRQVAPAAAETKFDHLPFALILLKPEQLARIVAMVAECFRRHGHTKN